MATSTSMTQSAACASGVRFAPSLSAGKERDTESGNDYFGARYYSSAMGRFMSPDPSQLYYADPTNPQSFNLYSYALNNPLKNSDPTGMYCYYGDTDYTSVQGQKDQADATQWDFHSNSSECGAKGGQWTSDAETHTDHSGISWDNDGRHEFAVSAISDAAPQPQVRYGLLGAEPDSLAFDPNFNYNSPDFQWHLKNDPRDSASATKPPRKLTKQEISDFCGIAGELSAGGTNPGGGLSNQDPSEDTSATKMDLPTKARFSGGQYAGHEYEVREVAPGGRAVDPFAGVLSAIATRNYCVYYATRANN